MSAPAIELRGVVKDYGAVRALDGIDLTVEPGQIFGFLGPNGAGKTTTIRILLDLIRPTAGSALVLGFDTRARSGEVRERCGYVPGELHLYESMTGDEFLDLIDSFRPARRDPAHRSMLVDRLALNVRARVRELSKGNKQKLALIQAMMHRPELLLLDEPTSGLDPLVQQDVAALLEDVARDGRTVFLSSHVLPEVERLSHAVAIVRAGKIVAIEDIARLKSRSVHMIEVTFAEAPPPAAFALSGVTVVRIDGATVHLRAQSAIDEVLKAIARYRVVDLRTEQAGIEDVFLAYYADDHREERARAAS